MWYSGPSIPITAKSACALALTSILGACATTGGEADPGGSGAAALDGADEGSIRCTYAYRASNEVQEGQTGEEPALQLVERVLLVAPGEQAHELLGQLTLTVSYTHSEYETDTINLSAAASDTNVLSILYQLGHQPPQNQFVGGHGFTGLIYFRHPTAGGDYQAFCEAVR
jgi:hypothetical protein